MTLGIQTRGGILPGGNPSPVAMIINIEFLAQLGQLAGGKHRRVEADPPCTAQDVLRRSIADDPETFRSAILDADGELRRWLLLLVHDEQVDWHTPVEVRDGDTIVVLAPIAGG